MKRAMFHKFTNFLQHAVETVSDQFTPNIPPQEEFVYHWKSVTCYFVDNKDGSVRIEETALPEHLSSMLRIIQEEESNLGEAGTTGACLEYLLQHRLLETLYTLGRTDHPPGMKQIVLSFFTKLLSRLSHPLLPHINVHRAVQRLVKACGETKAAPSEKEEIEFLCTVCAKIKTDPYLVNFFIEINKANPDNGSGKHSNSRPVPPFSLVDALLVLSESEDARVSVKACEGLMLCASLPEPSAASTLIKQTSFCKSISGKLSQLYDSLPQDVSPQDLDKVEAKWGFDIIIERNEQQSFDGKGHVISFLSWLDYCDQLISVSNPDVGTALSISIHEELLTGKMLPHLLQLSELGAVVSTTYLTRCLRMVSSQALLREFCFFLLGKDRSVELPDHSGHTLSKRLMERCNHLSEEVCVSTLKLFDTLLHKEDEHIYYCLLLRNLLGRAYVLEGSTTPPMSPVSAPEDMSPSLKENVDTVISSKSEIQSETLQDEKLSVEKEIDEVLTESLRQSDSKCEEFLRSIEKEKNSMAKEDLENPSTSNSTSEALTLSTCVTADISPTNSLPSSPTSSLFEKTEIHKVVNCFLSLLPEEAKSSYQTAESGYDMYLRDAHRQFAIQETVCKDWGWPKESSASCDWPEVPFYEGPFIHMLLEKLLHLLDQSYSVNLLLTAIISKVALIPHPNLHEFLLDPFLPTTEGTRTLFSVLTKVSNEIKQHQKSDPNFSHKLLMARKQLLGLLPTIHNLRINPLKSELPCDGSGFEDQGRMEAIIVLEEFCKELSAITFVKHHAAITKF